MQSDIKSQYARLTSVVRQLDELYHEAAEKMGLSDSASMIMYGLCEAARPCIQKELCDR